MSTEFDDSDIRHLVGSYSGTVVDNADPEKLARIRAEVPGLIDRTAWALPQASPGGGSPQRGEYNPPDIGAEVTIIFDEGDEDEPKYFCGHWARGEVPSPIEEATPEDAPKIKAWEGRRFLRVFDEREGQEKFYILDKETGDQIILDTAEGWQIQSTQKVAVQADGDVDVLSGGNISVNAAGNINAQSGGDANVDAGGNAELKAGGNANVEASGTVDVKGSTITLTAGSVNIAGGSVSLGAGGGSGGGVARNGDTVRVEIPTGTVLVPGGMPNPAPIIVIGTITDGSGTVKAAG